jgi:serine/threonine-protein kinase
MDFGIAKDMNGASLTTTGEIFGTAYYISPEQALGDVVTPASDLYSLGVLGLELLTGTKPFDRGTPIATALAQVEQPPPPLPDAVPADLAEAISACLAKDPLVRPTAADFILALAIELQVGPASLADTAPGMHRSVPAPRRALLDAETSTQQWVPVWRHVPADDSFQPIVPPTVVLDGLTPAD